MEYGSRCLVAQGSYWVTPGKVFENSSLAPCWFEVRPAFNSELRQDLDRDMIVKLYSKHYHIRCLNVKPEHQGHSGVARERIYLILTLKGLVEEIANPVLIYDQVSDFIMRYVKTEPQDC